VQVSTTTATRQEAKRIAAVVVEERLAACAQVSGPLASTYRWHGRIERAGEWSCHLKTTPKRLSALANRIQALHSYETPEIIVTPIVRGSSTYLAWINHEVSQDH
jgi:periplasmic divalent cation tolerance protein